LLLVGAVALLVGIPPATAGSLSDLMGDTFDPLDVGGPLPDIGTYGATTSVALGTTTFAVNFFNDILPPSALSAASVVGYIDIDTDRGATPGGHAPWGMDLAGGNNWINFFTAPNPGTPSIPPGPDSESTIITADKYYVNLFSEATHPGFVDVISTADNSVFATVPIAFTARGFTLTVPLVGTGDGSLDYDLLVGTYLEMTDRAPNGGIPSQSVLPEPAGLVLLGSGLAGLAILGRRSRARPRRAGAGAMTRSILAGEPRGCIGHREG
jgi:hypothetical protein